MRLVGLTGGIGSGKSTVAGMLVERGAVLIDADAITRELQEPGTAVTAAIAERFGGSVIAADGRLDRGALAAIVFGDPDELAALNAIVHPAVRREIDRRVEDAIGTEALVVVDIPLLAEHPREGCGAIVVVDCPVDVAVERLVGRRGFNAEDARARIARQATREQRLAIATHVVDNAGDIGRLGRHVDTLWHELQRVPRATPDDLARFRGSAAR